MQIGPSDSSADIRHARRRALEAEALHTRDVARERAGAPWVLPALLTVAFCAVTVGAAHARFSPSDLVVVTWLFGLLALSLCAAAQVVARLGAIPAVLASLLPSAVVVWHLRAQALVLDGTAAFALAVVAGAVPCAFLLVRARRALRASVALVWLVASGAALATSSVVAYRASDTLRWHLLHHARVLGVPTYLAIGNPVGPILDELWSAAGATPPVFPAVDTTPGGEAPDLVLVLIDTLRADALAAYGGDPSLMPRLNALAESSLVLDSLQVNASYTRSSVASIFTGLLPEEHGAVDHDYQLKEDRFTLAEALRRRGYETVAFVTNYLNVGRSGGFSQGFEHFDEVKTPGWAYARARDLNARVGAWLDGRATRPEGRPPLFLYLHYMDPHTPYLSGWKDPAPNPKAKRRGYDAELRYSDEMISEMIERLEAKLSPDTVFVLISDHGEEFGEHGSTGHGHALYRELLDVPALVHWTGGLRGRIATRLEGRDIFGLMLFLSRSGPEQLPEWAASHSREHRYASQYIRRRRVLHRPDRWFTVMRSLQDGRRQLIWSAFGPTEELYDLQVDPGQHWNLRDAQGAEAAALREHLVDAVSGWASREGEEIGAETEDLLKQLGYLE